MNYGTFYQSCSSLPIVCLDFKHVTEDTFTYQGSTDHHQDQKSQNKHSRCLPVPCHIWPCRSCGRCDDKLTIRLLPADPPKNLPVRSCKGCAVTQDQANSARSSSTVGSDTSGEVRMSDRIQCCPRTLHKEFVLVLMNSRGGGYGGQLPAVQTLCWRLFANVRRRQTDWLVDFCRIGVI